MYTKQEQKENRQKWVEALRSGKYKKTTLSLKDSKGFCCLGVACDISELEKWDILTDRDGEHFDVHEETYAYGEERSLISLPNDVMEWLGLRTPSGDYNGYDDGYDDSLTNDNDDEQKTFNEIADIIDNEPEGLVN